MFDFSKLVPAKWSNNSDIALLTQRECKTDFFEKKGEWDWGVAVGDTRPFSVSEWWISGAWIVIKPKDGEADML